MRSPLTFRCDEGFLRRLDAARGDVPRSQFVRDAVEAAVEGRVRPVRRPVAVQAPRGCTIVGLAPEARVALAEREAAA